jgi:glycosyltransferase involved in cell wall biosynthesis
MPQPLCVVILTLDEEINLRKAIGSVRGRVPVIVLDSGSTDRTRAIALELGAEVHERPFDDYASQRNHALDLVRDRFSWVLFLDADEAIGDDLWDDLLATVERSDVAGAYVGLHLRLLGYDITHGGPGHYAGLRLMRPDRVRFSRGVNERVDDAGLPTVKLRGKIIHEDLRPLSQWFQKHVRYAQREAATYLGGEDRRRGLEGFGLRTKGARMIGIRWVYNRLPLFVRPFMQFGRTLVIQSAWRDGLPGLMFAAMQSLWYPMVIDLLIHEQRRQGGRGAR